MRVAVYYAGAIVLGEIDIRIVTGLEPAHIAVFSVVLPLVSIDWVRRSMRRLPELDLPKPMGKPQLSEVPWKPVLLMGVCTLATGFGVLPDKPLVAGNIVGTVLMALFVFFGVLVVVEVVQFRHHVPTGVSLHDRRVTAHRFRSSRSILRRRRLATTRDTPCCLCSSSSC